MTDMVRTSTTQEFTLEQAARWDAWQRANAAAAHRSDRMFRALGIAGFAVSVAALAGALWRGI